VYGVWTEASSAEEPEQPAGRGPRVATVVRSGFADFSSPQ